MEQSSEKALKWCSEAAKKGYAPAQHGFGRMYYNGIGVPKNLEAAAEWVSKPDSDYGGEIESALRVKIAWALFDKVYNASQLNDRDRRVETIASYRALIARFKQATEPALRECVAKAFLNSSFLLVDLKRWSQVIAAHDAMNTNFEATTDPALRQLLTRSLLNKGVALHKLNSWSQAIEAFDAVFAYFKEATETELCELAAKALVNKGLALSQLQRSKDAITTYEAVIKLFGSATELELLDQVAKARNAKNALENQGS